MDRKGQSKTRCSLLAATDLPATGPSLTIIQIQSFLVALNLLLFLKIFQHLNRQLLSRHPRRQQKDMVVIVALQHPQNLQSR